MTQEFVEIPEITEEAMAKAGQVVDALVDCLNSDELAEHSLIEKLLGAQLLRDYLVEFAQGLAQEVPHES